MENTVLKNANIEGENEKSQTNWNITQKKVPPDSEILVEYNGEEMS